MCYLLGFVFDFLLALLFQLKVLCHFSDSLVFGVNDFADLFGVGAVPLFAVEQVDKMYDVQVVNEVDEGIAVVLAFFGASG